MFRDYWIRIAYGPNGHMVKTMHSGEVKDSASRDLLSTREREVLFQIAEGLDTRDIAGKHGISVNTVGNHRSNMVQRLGARDTTALVQIAKMASLI